MGPDVVGPDAVGTTSLGQFLWGRMSVGPNVLGQEDGNRGGGVQCAITVEERFEKRVVRSAGCYGSKPGQT